MKVIVDYCNQPKAYADSRGECVIQLDDDETIQDVIDKYVNIKQNWWEQRYSNAVEIQQYTEKRYLGDVVHTGRLVLMKTFQIYLD